MQTHKTLLLILLLSFPLFLSAQDGRFEEAYQASENFMANIERGSVETAVSTVHPEAFEFDPQEVWINFFYNLAEQVGDIESYELYDQTFEYGDGEAGEGFYYEYFYKVKHSNMVLYEKVVVFHRTIDEYPQVLGFFYNENKDNL